MRRPWWTGFVLLSTVSALVALAEASSEGGARRFAQATEWEAQGRFAEAADALERLARDLPQDSYAADAIFEAAVIAEEHLLDPERALVDYQQVVERYRQSRLARRAEARVVFLSSSLRTGAQPLREYQEIMTRLAPQKSSEATERMERLLAAHPDFSLADQALYTLETIYLDRGDDSQAAARLRALDRRFPDSEWSHRGKVRWAEHLLGSGHPFAARHIYLELAAHPERETATAAEEGLTAVRSYLLRRSLLFLSGLYLVLFAMLSARRAGFRVRPLPSEMHFYLPVALLFVLAAAAENRAVGRATFGLAFGGALVTLLSGATPVSMRTGPNIVRGLLIVIAVAAVVDLSLECAGLTDFVIATFVSGPERE